MKRNYFLLFISIVLTQITFGQTVSTLINQVSQAGIIQMVREFSGEDSTLINGNKVLLKNRVSSIGNNVAADYLADRLNSYGLTVSVINYSTGGRNVVATKLGLVHPDSIYIISAHYDAVANYCADDNASGVTAVLESARILSNYTFENTVVFALWDEEEIGEKGAKNYAVTASQNNLGIKAVLNMDMIAYDGDNDKLFDIDVRNIANSYQIKNDLINIVTNYSLNLVSNVVDPGTLDSDHAAFWTVGYSAALLGEAWSTNDIDPAYHSSNDRISLFNVNYFYNMVKLCVGYITTKAVLINTTGISSLSPTIFKIYPNPTKADATIDFGNQIIGELEVVNIYGSIVIKQNIDGQQAKINLEGIASGIYILQIRDDQGNFSKLKLIKE